MKWFMPGIPSVECLMDVDEIWYDYAGSTKAEQDETDAEATAFPGSSFTLSARPAKIQFRL